MSHVYLLMDDVRSVVKIGVTRDVNSRIAAIRSSTASILRLVRTLPGTKRTERWFHERYAEQCIGGEWFKWSGDMETIEPPVEEQADPVRLHKRVETAAAMAADIHALGGPGDAAKSVLPTRPRIRGADLMRAWGNAARQEEPSLDEVIHLIEVARAKAGYSEVARYIEHRLNCRIEFLTPEDEIAKLQREFIAATEQQVRNTERMERAVERLEILKGRR